MDTEMKANKNGRINIVLQDERHVLTKEQERHHFSRSSKQFQKVDDVFASFVGLENIKSTMKQVYATLIINEKRRELGILSNKQVLHMLFMGNPGTGKTTVARKLAELYVNLGVLSKGHLIEVERADLVGEYIGQTAQKTRDVIERAKGGILFIDEAYALARGGEKDFGKEAIDTLVKHMEDHHNNFILILAGYPKEMKSFLNINPGLESRFPFILEFPNYSLDQLVEIAKRMVYTREYKMTIEAELELKYQLEKQFINEYPNFSNARAVRNIIERAIRLHAYRLVSRNEYHIKPNALVELIAEDMRQKE